MQTRFVLIIFIILAGFWNSAQAAQKAKIISPEVEIYADSNFDAEVVDVVKQGETYLVSDQVIGAFYKIKLKSGHVGFIPDHEVEIAGKGRVQPKDFDEVILAEDEKRRKNKKAKIPEEIDPEEEFERVYQGLTLQMINFHEDTLGAIQVDDLLAVGYKSIGDLSWEVIGAFKAPKYYSEKLNASANGVNLWADFGISNRLEMGPRFMLRYGASFFAHISQIKVSAPTKSYILQDITAGVLLEAAAMVKFQGSAVDFSLKYFFDRNPYGGFGVSFVF